MGATYIAERRDLREGKGLKPPETYDDFLKLTAALTEDGKRFGLQMPGEKLYIGFVHPAEWLAANGGGWGGPQTWGAPPHNSAVVRTPREFPETHKEKPRRRAR